jgi:hypothetical protein
MDWCNLSATGNAHPTAARQNSGTRTRNFTSGDRDRGDETREIMKEEHRRYKIVK